MHSQCWCMAQAMDSTSLVRDLIETFTEGSLDQPSSVYATEQAQSAGELTRYPSDCFELSVAPVRRLTWHRISRNAKLNLQRSRTGQCPAGHRRYGTHFGHTDLWTGKSQRRFYFGSSLPKNLAQRDQKVDRVAFCNWCRSWSDRSQAHQFHGCEF